VLYKFLRNTDWRDRHALRSDIDRLMYTFFLSRALAVLTGDYRCNPMPYAAGDNDSVDGYLFFFFSPPLDGTRETINKRVAVSSALSAPIVYGGTPRTGRAFSVVTENGVVVRCGRAQKLLRWVRRWHVNSTFIIDRDTSVLLSPRKDRFRSTRSF
jgi:hypothetical protein